MTYSSPYCMQLALELFPPPSFAELLSQGHVTTIAVEASPRLRCGWRAVIDAKTGLRRLTVPAFLESAPREVKSALIDWALLPVKARGQVPRRRKKNLERLVFDYIASTGIETRNRSTFDPCRYSTKGIIHDLAEVFDSLNSRFFNNTVISYMRWGRHPLRSYQTTRRGPRGERCNLITIGAMYNRPDVPRYAIEGIMHHEMLHIAVPPLVAGARNIIHGPQFKQKERLFPHYRDWIEWEKIQCKRIARRV